MYPLKEGSTCSEQTRSYSEEAMWCSLELAFVSYLLLRGNIEPRPGNNINDLSTLLHSPTPSPFRTPLFITHSLPPFSPQPSTTSSFINPFPLPKQITSSGWVSNYFVFPRDNFKRASIPGHIAKSKSTKCGKIYRAKPLSNR